MALSRTACVSGLAPGFLPSALPWLTPPPPPPANTLAGFVLSVTDYFAKTSDAALMVELAPAVESKLEHAQAVWGSTVRLGFYGWDDRTGAGFAGVRASAEAQAAYRFLAMRAWLAWAGVLRATGNATGAEHWQGYYDAAVNATRAAGPAWYAPLGLFASADALNAGFVAPAEAAAMVRALFNDSVTICALSPFNTFFVLQALAVAGELDRGTAAVHLCWDGMLRLGATTTWEIAKPAWDLFLHPTDNVPGFQGFTSLAHPWSSGATAWVTANLAGVRPTAPGYAAYTVAPHIAGAMRGVAATVPLPSGQAIGVRAEAAGQQLASLCVAAPQGLAGTLEVSQLLAARLLSAGSSSGSSSGGGDGGGPAAL